MAEHYTEADFGAAILAGLAAYAETQDKRFKGDPIAHEYRAVLDAAARAIATRAVQTLADMLIDNHVLCARCAAAVDALTEAWEKARS